MLNQKTVVLNTAKELNTKHLFQLLKLKSKCKITDVNYHHMIFIIHQINFFTKKYGWCDFDSKGYYQTLGCTPNVVSTILDILRDENILKRTRRGNNENGKVSSYVYIKPFSISESDEHRYLFNFKNTPKFINVWVANNFKIVRKPEGVTAPRGEKKPAKIKNLSRAQLILENEQLKAELASLRAFTSSTDESIVAIERVSVTTKNEVKSELFIPATNSEFSKNKDVTLNHVPLEHEETPHIFKYGSDTYSVSGWDYLVQIMSNDNLSVEEVQDDIYYSNKNREEEIYENLKIYKKYDFSDQRYNVLISA
jgi:hypothetical protein